MDKNIENIKILLFEDNQGDAGLIEAMLEEFIDLSELKIVETLDEGLNLLKEHSFDVILLDLGLPDNNGIDTFIDVHKISPNIPIIILTGLNDEDMGIKAVKKGAQDYLVKGQVNDRLLERSIRYSIERKKAEDKLKATIDELKRSNKELRNFAFITSHDLQEPLRTMGSYAGLLKYRYKGQLDGDADEFLDYMVSGAIRMQDMIKGLLDYSHVGTQGSKFNEFNAEEALKGALYNLKSSIEGCNAEITYDSMPVIYADKNQIRIVFQNLIDNSLKFCRDGISPKIHISAEKEGNEYVFSVQDNGIGIEEPYTDRIFGVFKRLHPIGEYDGAGIGLSIVKRIMGRHNGHIWVKSEFGKGSTFYFTIPC